MKVESDHLLGDGKIFPPGFRFHPTDEELVLYYLKKKICCKRLRMDVIAEIDVYKWDPEELPGMSKLKTGDRQWFFFSPRDRKYPNGARSNRATKYGYWKATGKDRVISCGSRAVGLKKTLVFYRGRAPSGERTDWVMHEYTMDEEELKRCDNVQDYYALYKAYKKSGPGPKNGEQYGAPFREEDWAEDDLEVQCLAQKDGSVKQTIETTLIIDTQTVEFQNAIALDDLEQIMNNLIADDLILEEPFSAGSGFGLDQFLAEEINDSIRAVPLPVVEPQNQPPMLHARFDLSGSTTTQSQIWEAPEVTSAPAVGARDPLDTEADYLEDFLELDDLIGPVPAVAHVSENSLDNLGFHQLNEMDGLDDFDLYHDASLLFDEIHTVENGQMSRSHTYVDNSANQVPGIHIQNLENAAVSYQFQPQFYNDNLISSQIWANEPSCCDLVAAEANPDYITASSSGVVHGNHEFVTTTTGANETSSSWLSSTLWSFVESIPTTPASASEIALVNRAFERMSSFSRVRINVGNNSSASLRKYRRNFVCFSLIGLVCAVLWMVMN